MNDSLTVIITGASRGIGRAITESLVHSSEACQMQKMVLIARNQKKLDEVASSLRLKEPSIDISGESFDLELVDLIPDLIDKIALTLTGNVLLINNAGYTLPASVLETDNQNLLKTFSVNVFSPIILVRELLRARAGLKTIINIASTAGMSPRPGWLSYASSKAALINASLTMYEELLPYGIDVYCLSPGRCATDLRATLAPDEDQSKIMQPEEVANVVMNIITAKQPCHSWAEYCCSKANLQVEGVFRNSN
jgi:3-oxoacyl-[acyl-carrier protein] reductase